MKCGCRGSDTAFYQITFAEWKIYFKQHMSNDEGIIIREHCYCRKIIHYKKVLLCDRKRRSEPVNETRRLLPPAHAVRREVIFSQVSVHLHEQGYPPGYVTKDRGVPQTLSPFPARTGGNPTPGQESEYFLCSGTSSEFRLCVFVLKYLRFWGDLGYLVDMLPFKWFCCWR